MVFYALKTDFKKLCNLINPPQIKSYTALCNLINPPKSGHIRPYVILLIHPKLGHIRPLFSIQSFGIKIVAARTHATDTSHIVSHSKMLSIIPLTIALSVSYWIKGFNGPTNICASKHMFFQK